MENPNISEARARRFSRPSLKQIVQTQRTNKINLSNTKSQNLSRAIDKQQLDYLKKELDYAYKQEEKYEERYSKNKRDSDRAKDYAYRKLQQEIKSILSKVEKGEVFDKKQIESYLSDVYSYNRKKKLNKLRKNEVIETPLKSSNVQTYTSIVNPNAFYNDQSNKLLNAKDRKKFQQEFTSEYGFDRYTEVVNIANKKRDDANYKISDLRAIENKIREKEKSSGTRIVGDKSLSDLSTRVLVKEYNKNLLTSSKIKVPTLSARPEEYAKAREELQKKNKELQKNINRIVENTKYSKTQAENLRNKVLTGQSIKPNERDIYLALVIQDNKDLTQAQKNLFINGLKELKPSEIKKNYDIVKKKGASAWDYTTSLKFSDVKEKGDVLANKLKGVTPSMVRNVFVSDSSIKALNKIGSALKDVSKEQLNSLFSMKKGVSQETKNKFKNSVKNLSTKEKFSIIADSLGLLGVTKGGVLLIKGGLKKFGIKKIGGNIVNKPIGIVKQSLMFSGSIINNAGLGQRAYESSQKFFNVNNKFLTSKAKELGFTGAEQLYKDYLNVVQSKFKDKTIKLEDLGGFLGVDTAGRNSILKAQKQYQKFLKDKGLKTSEINEIIANLESKRRSRVYGQIIGAIGIEVSSERLADKLIKGGLKKSDAIGTAAVRETAAVLAQEGFVQQNNITPQDMFGAVLLGSSFLVSPDVSKFFSKAKYKKLNKKDLEKATNKVANKLNKDIKKGKRVQYALKSLKSQGLKDMTKGKLLKEFNAKEINDLSKNYIKNQLAKNRSRKVSKITEKKMLRDPIANILDIYEYPGDLIYNYSQELKKKVLKLKPIKRKKVKSLVVTKTASKTKTSNKATSKAVSKTKTKAKSKVKTKAKAKTKTKAKTKISTKSKTKSKAKTKTKAKAKTKTKAKSKVKTIPLPTLKLPEQKKIKQKGLNIAYSLRYIKNGQTKVLKINLPKFKAIQRAIKEARAKGLGRVQIIPTAGTKNKDIKKVLIPKTYSFKSGTIISELKKK